MSLDVWFSFVVLAGIVVLSPGPAVLLAVTHAGQFGPKRAIVPILGNVTGLGIMTALTAYGLGSLLEASSDWFLWLRIAGGLYLVYLGIKLIRSKPATLPDGTQGLAVMPSQRKSYLQGVMVALSNPKAILFIGALFPQFIDVAQPVWGQFLLLGVTQMAMSFAALVMYAVLSGALVSKGKQALYSKVNKVTGALFVIFGITLAAGSR